MNRFALFAVLAMALSLPDDAEPAEDAHRRRIAATLEAAADLVKCGPPELVRFANDAARRVLTEPLMPFLALLYKLGQTIRDEWVAADIRLARAWMDGFVAAVAECRLLIEVEADAAVLGAPKWRA